MPDPVPDSGPQRPVPPGLSERDRAILDFERKPWSFAGAKEQAMRDRFGMVPTRYYQILNAVLDTPEALAYDPLLVQRLRRVREARGRARGTQRLARPGQVPLRK